MQCPILGIVDLESLGESSQQALKKQEGFALARERPDSAPGSGRLAVGIDRLGELKWSFNLSEREKWYLKRTEIEMLCKVKKAFYSIKTGDQNR